MHWKSKTTLKGKTILILFWKEKSTILVSYRIKLSKYQIVISQILQCVYLYSTTYLLIYEKNTTVLFLNTVIIN